MELPANLDAEKGLLSCALQDHEARSKIIRAVSPDVFYHPAHRTLYKHINEMHDAGSAIDFITVTHHLGEGLDELGGKVGLDEIWNFVPTGSGWSYYKDILQDASFRRKAILASDAIRRLGSDLGDRSARSRIEEISLGLSQPAASAVTEGLVYANVLATNFAQWLEDLNSGDVADRGMPWACDGLPELIDKLRPGELCLVGGRPGSGKTSLLNSQVALTVMPKALRAVVFSLEMTRLEETMRLVSIHGRLPLHALKNRGLMTPENVSSYSSALKSLDASQIAISDEILDIYEIYERAAAYRKDKGQLDLIGIDYAQLIKVRNSDDRRLGLDEVGRLCKYMAKELDTHVMLLTSINRMDGLPFDCTSLEYHCDMFIEAKKSEPGDKYKNFTVRKNRNGPIGEAQVSWYERCAALYDRERSGEILE